MSVLPYIPSGAWPSLMTAKTAAGYLDEKSVESFRRKVGNVYPQPIRLMGIGERWRKVDLDRRGNGGYVGGKHRRSHLMKPADWPRYMLAKKLAGGKVGYFWNPRPRDIAAGFP